MSRQLGADLLGSGAGLEALEDLPRVSSSLCDACRAHHDDVHEGLSRLGIEVVRDELRPIRSRLRGAFIGLGGNLGALERETRFVERDLNRRWFARDVEALLERDAGTDQHEDAEQREVLDIMHKIIAGSPGEVCVLDLHSTSSRSPAFVCMPDALWNHELAFALRVPVLLGLEEAIEGTMLGYFSDLGHTTVCFEGGIHGARETLEAHVAAIMVGLVTAGLVRASDVRGYERHVERLEDIGFYEEVAEAPLSTQLLEAMHCFPAKYGLWALMNPRVGAEGTSS